MLKSTIMVSLVLYFFVTYIHGNPISIHENSSSPTTIFIKPKANVMRRLNPLKLFFTVAYTPTQEPPYSIEWNLSLLKTMLLESNHVSNDDKELFLMKFSNIENDYADWSFEKHDELERFTEKYFNLYKSPDLFLPFRDCSALTYALTEEMLNDLQLNVNDEKRSKIRAKAVQRLCDSE
ncbi:unnamed protein product [Rotaria sordida]|uniref:Uncharacterized protein n=1 Tax=Rotaria sordida TaxID=392033 RepID=A0A819J8Y2_9BILA|nr:unnamed protein product [Rotaria sordida]CAF3926441.1 unnamed protein product [Rotaria sordida]